MIIVTHEMAFARDVADQVIFMDGGFIVEQGDPKQVIDHPQEERTKSFWPASRKTTDMTRPRALNSPHLSDDPANGGCSLSSCAPKTAGLYRPVF